jgi:hypothetical protein
MSKGGDENQTQTQTQSIDPAARQAYIDNLALAKSTASNLGVQKFAEFTPEYQAAQQRLTNLGMTGFTPESISKFTNPYQQEVIDTAMGDIERQRQMQQLADASSATRAGAFGGTRQAVQSALTNEAALRQGASTTAQLRSQGYGQAATLAQQAQQMGMQGAGAVMTAQQQQQALEQQRLDAQRNLALQRLAIQQSATGVQPANLGMTGTGSTPMTGGTNGLGAALGGAAGFALTGGNPAGAMVGASIGGLL